MKLKLFVYFCCVFRKIHELTLLISPKTVMKMSNLKFYQYEESDIVW